MKKKVLAVVSVCMLVLLAACGGAEDKKDGDGKSDVKVNVDVNVDTNQDTQQGDKQDNADSKPVEEGPVVYTAKQAILDAEWYSGMIQVNDKLIQMPTSLNELVAMGFDYVIDDGDKNKDYLFADGERISYDLLLDGKEVCTLRCEYVGDKLVTLEEINPKVESISFTGIKETELTYFLPGGVALGDTMQAVEEKLGEPLVMEASKYNFNYTYGRPSKGNDQCEVGVSVNVNRDSQVVSGFQVSRNIVPSTYEEFSAGKIVSVKNLQSEDVHDVQLILPETYLYSGNDMPLRNAETVFEKDGNFYCIKLSFSGTLQKYFSQYELQGAGTLLYEDTDENGVSRYVYDTGVIYCFKEPFVMKLSMSLEPLTKTDVDVKALHQEYLLELGKTVQY